MHHEHSLQQLLENFRNVTQTSITYVPLQSGSNAFNSPNASVSIHNGYLHACFLVPELQTHAAQREADALSHLLATHTTFDCFHPFPETTSCLFPVYSHGVLLGCLIFGPLRNHPQLSESTMHHFPTLAPVAKAYEALPLYDDAVVMAANRLLPQIVIYTNRLDALTQDSRPLSEQIEEYINTFYMNPISPATACEHFHISRSKLNHTLSKSFDKTFLTQLHQCRIQNVCRLLNDGVSIEEAATRCGFSSPAYMARVFHQMVGCSPTTYLKNHPPQTEADADQP